MSILRTTVRRVAEARRRRAGMRTIAELPDYLLADLGLMRDWRGDLQKLPAGFVR